MNTKIGSIHPGEVLLEDFMKPLNLSISDVAKALGVQPITISLIIRSKRSVSAEMALRLERWTKVSGETWLRIQARYDWETTQKRLGDKLDKIVKPLEIHAVPG